jgi:tetratricopeptide (TPR) repeat protein
MPRIELSLEEAMVLINGHEYGRAIAILEEEASNESRSPLERAGFCEWVAECHRRLEDYREAGEWYLEAIKRVFAQEIDLSVKAREALPLCQKALNYYKMGGDKVDVMEAAKLKQRLLELSR